MNINELISQESFTRWLFGIPVAYIAIAGLFRMFDVLGKPLKAGTRGMKMS